MRTLQVNIRPGEQPQQTRTAGLRRPYFARYLHPMLIGELAKQAGVNLESIRFYEREGLLPCPPRAQSGYRSYDQRHLETIRFIKRSQALGFTLSEIRQLLHLHERLASSKLRKNSRTTWNLFISLAKGWAPSRRRSRLSSPCGSSLRNSCAIYQLQKKLICPAGTVRPPESSAIPLDSVPEYWVRVSTRVLQEVAMPTPKNSRARRLGHVVDGLSWLSYCLSLLDVGRQAMHMQTAAAAKQRTAGDDSPSRRAAQRR